MGNSMNSLVIYDKTKKSLICNNPNKIPNVCNKYLSEKKCLEHYKKCKNVSGLHKCPYGFNTYCGRGKIYTCLILNGDQYKQVKTNIEKYNQKVNEFQIYNEEFIVDYINDIEEVEMNNITLRDCIHDLRNMGAQFNSMSEEFKSENKELSENSEPAKSLLSMYELLNYRLDILNEIESYKSEKFTKKLHPILMKLVLLLKYQARKKDIVFDLSPIQNNATLITKYTYLGLYILLENAVKHSLPREKVYITFAEDERTTKVIIKNIGQKIEKDEIQFLGTRGYRGKNTITKGTGLGLEMAKRIFEENDCIFKIDVVDNGKYSDFIVSVEFNNK